MDGKQYVIFRNSCYKIRDFTEISFQGFNLNASRQAFNKGMSRVRVTFEWIFKESKLYWTTVDYKRKIRISESM